MLVLVLGIASGAFSVVMLFYGIGGLIYLIRHPTQADGEDWFEVSMFAFIGHFCAFVAIRWFRAALKIARGG